MNILNTLQLQLSTSTLYWREPLWLLLALQPLIIILLRQLWRRRQFTSYADRDLQPWVIMTEHQTTRQRLLSKNTAYVIAWFFLAIAVAGPRSPHAIPNTEISSVASIMLVVDISASMRATDVYPNRLRRVHLEIQELLGRMQGFRVGMIVYAARPHLYIPLTLDHKAFEFYLDQIESLELPTAGSQAASAIEQAINQFDANTESKSIILISDGDFNSNTDPTYLDLLNLKDTLQKANIKLHVLGAGTVEGEAIPVADGWLEHEGRAVITRMNEAALMDIASITHGIYSAIQEDDSDWQAIFDNGIAQSIKTRVSDDKQHIQWNEYYYLPLILGIILLWLSMIPFRIKSGKRFWVSIRPARTRISTVTSLLFLVLVFHQTDVNANDLENQAYRYYLDRDFSKSQNVYKNVIGYQGRLGEGAAQYQLQEYENAVRSFAQATLDAATDTDRGKALYNLGNSYYMQGDYSKAIQVYKDALLYSPNHQPSVNNLTFSLALQQAVEARLQEGSASRAGSGPRRAAANALIEPNQRSSLSLENNQEPKISALPLPTLPGAGDAAFQALVERGLAHIRLAADATQASAVDMQTQNIRESFIFKQSMIELDEQQSILWKRLFELEEGFEAPVASPKPVPDILPW